MSDRVRYEAQVADGVAVLTLARPEKRNALDPETIADIEEEADRLRRLAEDLLVLSRAEGGRLVLAHDPLVIRHVVRQAVESGNFKVYETQQVATNHFPLNNEHPFLSDKSVRQAMMYALDRDAIVSKIFFGAYMVATGPIPGSTPIAVPSTQPMKQYSRLIGVKATPKVTMTARNGPTGWYAGGQLTDGGAGGLQVPAATARDNYAEH